MPSSGLLTIHLSSSSSPAAAAAIAVAGDGGVDLGEVGRALGLDPAAVRLNGYFLSRGPGHVSSVAWRSLLTFFSARALPAGAAAAAPIAVHGKPSPSPSAWNPIRLKRKSRLEDEQSLKKSRLTESSSTQLSEDITLSMKRRLRLEDANPVKRIKHMECNSGSVDGAVDGASSLPRVKFSCSFINGREKRPREEEVVTSLPCKRVR